jgi:hypothetical protein
MIGVVVRVGEERGMGGVGGAVVAHDPVKVTTMKNAVKYLGHCVGWVRRAVDFVKEHEATLDPFLGSKLLKV